MRPETAKTSSPVATRPLRRTDIGTTRLKHLYKTVASSAPQPHALDARRCRLWRAPADGSLDAAVPTRWPPNGASTRGR